MIPNNNLSVLPFYNSIEKQNHRKDYAFGEVYPLFTPNKRVLPFQIIRAHDGKDISYFAAYLIDVLTGAEINIRDQLLNAGLALTQFSDLDYDIISYPDLALLSVDTPEGRYYVQVHDTTSSESWYSEVFTVVRSVSEYLKLSYSNNTDLIFEKGRILFPSLFEFRLYLPTQLGRPDYEFEETVDKRDGYQFIEKQISEKTYKFNFVAPEYLLDALRVVRMMDNITVTSKGETYSIDQFLMTPKWLDGGYLASVDVEFQCDTVIKKTSSTAIVPVGGDFNNDFNNDFLKQ